MGVGQGLGWGLRILPLCLPPCSGRGEEASQIAGQQWEAPACLLHRVCSGKAWNHGCLAPSLAHGRAQDI